MAEILAIIIPILIVRHCVMCRERHQVKFQHCSLLLSKYIDDREHPLSACETLYRLYKLTQFWVLLPVVTLIFPFVFVYKFVKLQLKSPIEFSKLNDKEFTATFFSIMEAYKAKNPITSFICLLIVSFMMSIAMLIIKALRIPIPKSLNEDMFLLIPR